VSCYSKKSVPFMQLSSSQFELPLCAMDDRSLDIMYFLMTRAEFPV